MLEERAVPETLEERLERQRLVIETQAEILDALGFDGFEIADAAEKATPRVRHRGRTALIATAWAAPGPWFFIGDHAALHYALKLLA